MDDLAHFVRALALATRPHSRPGQSVELGDIAGTILPYRTHRDALDLASIEDYDAMLVRLAAGEGGYATTEPADAAGAFRAQAGSPNPDLDIVRSLGATRLVLTAAAWRLLEAEPGSDYAPPAPAEAPMAPEPPPEPPAGPDRSPPFIIAPDELERISPDDPDGPACEFCGGRLPEGRVVSYCPHCGQSQSQPHCPACGQDIEPAWHHCVACGQRLM